MSLRLARRPGIAAALMLVALLPSVLYVGHWSMRLPVPGTDAFVALGMQAEHEAQASEGGHEEHCHGTASCTDSPPTPSMGFALLNEALALLAAAGLLVLVAGPGSQLRALAGMPPVLPPPRLPAA